MIIPLTSKFIFNPPDDITLCERDGAAKTANCANGITQDSINQPLTGISPKANAWLICAKTGLTADEPPEISTSLAQERLIFNQEKSSTYETISTISTISRPAKVTETLRAGESIQEAASIASPVAGKQDDGLEGWQRRQVMNVLDEKFSPTIADIIRRRLASWPVWAVERFLPVIERIQRQTHYSPDNAAAVAVESIGAAAA